MPCLGLQLVLGLGLTTMAVGQQGYQMQGAPPPSMPSAYAQQSFAPPPGAGLQGYPQQRYQTPNYAQSPYVTNGGDSRYAAPKAVPRTQTYQQPRYQQAPAYQQPVYQQQQQPSMPAYPAYGQQQPMPYPQPGSLMPRSKPVRKIISQPYGDGGVTTQIASLKANDRVQDRRLSDLERQTFPPATTTSNRQGWGQHQVVLGDSLSSIANRYGTSVEDLKRINHRSTNVVMTGEVLTVPVRGSKGGYYQPPTPKGDGVLASTKSGGTHIVQRGESLSQIAAAYRISVKSLQDANGIRNANVITPGQRLKIPGGKTGTVIASTAKPKTSGKQYISSPSKPSKPKETLLVAGVPSAGAGLGPVIAPSGPRGVTSYRVEHGDTMESVAQSFASTPTEIQRINKLSSPRLPEVGDEIVVPLPGSVSL